MPRILERLVNQLKGKVENPYAAATAQLEKHGILKPGTEELTAYGRKRDAMTPEQRAKDRASKYTGRKHAPGEYSYNAATNRTKLK